MNEWDVIKELREALTDARDHLQYCGYGDKWERECAQSAKLPQQIQKAIDKADEFLAQ
jgi:hypothetical protein